MKNEPDWSISPAKVRGAVHARVQGRERAEALAEQHRPVTGLEGVGHRRHHLVDQSGGVRRVRGVARIAVAAGSQ